MLIIIDLNTKGKPKPMNKDNVVIEDRVTAPFSFMSPVMVHCQH